MKKLYILLFLAFSFIANAQIVNIPDANFKAALLSANPSNLIASTEATDIYGNVSNYNTIDQNANGEIEESEASLITYLILVGSNISDLTGIEFFTNLSTLRCDNNQLSDLNVSNNTNLKVLNCNNNLLTNLDVSSKIFLKYLHFDNNPLESININNCDSLVSIDFSGLFDIQTITASDCLNLQDFTIVSNYGLIDLNLSDCTSLNYLNCNSNNLSNINLTNCNNLEYLDCSYNQLSNININDLNNLIYFDCSNNIITNLNFLNNPNIGELYCENNNLDNIDLGALLNLTFLYCNSNNLNNLNLDNNYLLEGLACGSNQIDNLNIKNTVISYIDFSNSNNLNYICANDDNLDLVQQKIIDYGYTNCHVNTYCSFVPGGEFYEITGNTIFDYNTDGCDVSDINYSNLNFTISDGTNTGSMIANQTGNYYIPVVAGNHTVTPVLENPSYFTISPTSFVVNFPTQASPFAQDFCVTANGVKSDVEVMMLSTVPARPGFDATYKIVYRNKGNQIENGSISLTFDDNKLDYVSSNPIYNTSATNTFSWNYSNLQPFETREIAIVLNVNSPMESPAINNGDVLNYTALITTTNTDETPNDNTFTLNQTVVGSYDPNDKTCLEGITITPSMVGEFVHYVIRFENTGTYPAQNIVVKDMIDLAKFDIATLVPLKGSHEFFTRIKDNKVEFIFENINLDFNDATNDGYVAFKIKTKSNLVIGNTFSNDANIYFDYNFPITTNTYTTTIAALSTQNFEFGSEFALYPNPAKDVLNIQSKNSLEVKSIEVYNLLGQVVLAVPNATNTVDVSNLKTGTYFVKVNTEKGSSNTKFIKE